MPSCTSCLPACMHACASPCPHFLTAHCVSGCLYLHLPSVIVSLSFRPPLLHLVAEEDRRKLREEAAKKNYNAMAPPMAAYTSEVALASVETALSGAGAVAAAPQVVQGLAEKRALIAKTTTELDEEAKKKAEQVGWDEWAGGRNGV